MGRTDAGDEENDDEQRAKVHARINAPSSVRTAIIAKERCVSTSGHGMWEPISSTHWLKLA